MRLRSFRLRLLIGSVLWTMGLLFVAHMLSLAVMHHVHGRAFVPFGTFAWGAAFSAVSMTAGIVLVWKGLRSLRELHARVSALRDGRERRVAGEYPSEVQHRENDLTALLEHRELLVDRAQAKAGDRRAARDVRAAH